MKGMEDPVLIVYILTNMRGKVKGAAMGNL